MSRKNIPSTDGTVSKPLAEVVLRPSGHDGGWGMSIPTIVAFGKGKDNWAGPNVKMENNSKKALRVVVYDATEEWEASVSAEREAAERKQLAVLQKKYAK